MKCPFCSELNSRVVDSRLGKDSKSIRRRRECLVCQKRFTTHECVEVVPLAVIKKDGRREEFSREKVRQGIKKACEKRPISMDAIDGFMEELELDLQETGAREVPSDAIGEKIMKGLHALDPVAYVRFASVYREFKDVNDFFRAVKNVLNENDETPGETKTSARSGSVE